MSCVDEEILSTIPRDDHSADPEGERPARMPAMTDSMIDCAKRALLTSRGARLPQARALD